MIVGLVFVLASSAIFWFIPKLTTVIQIEVVLIVACVLLGIGTSTTNICSSSLASDLIGLNTECGAFVYGVMSFADKIANGVVIAALQQFNPCSNDATDVCRLYYREILTFIPAAVAVLTVIMTITIWRTKIGGNRHEMVVLTNHDLEATKRLLNDEEDYEQRETGVWQRMSTLWSNALLFVGLVRWIERFLLLCADIEWNGFFRIGYSQWTNKT